MKTAAILQLAAHAQAPAARIKIDTDRRIGEVSPPVFGNFAEHLGGIQGGAGDWPAQGSDALLLRRAGQWPTPPYRS